MSAPFRIPDVEVIVDRPKAILVSDGNTKLWVPKSVIHEDSDVWDSSDEGQGPGDLLVAEWWAEKEGLV